MLVVTVLMYTAYSMSIVSGHEGKIEQYIPRHRINQYFPNIFDIITKSTPPTQRFSTENTISTDVHVETTTKNNEDVICEAGQSAFKKADLISIIELFAEKHQIKKGLNDSYYQNAIQVREKYNESFKIFEETFEDRPHHLKHILEDMVQARQRIEPIVKQTESLLSQFATHENSFNSTQDKANKLLEHLKNSTEICRLNCEHADLKNIITMTSSRQLAVVVDSYCDTFEELTNKIIQRLVKFRADYSQKLRNKVDNDSQILKEKIANIKHELKTAAVEQFGMTMYDILYLQDQYFHFSADIQQYNITIVVQEIQQKNYEINSKLVELGSMTKKYRNYCNSCNNKLVYTASNPLQHETNIDENNPSSVLDEAFQEYEENITAEIDAQYNQIFEEINHKLDENTIVEAYLSKLKPIQAEVGNQTQKEVEIFEHLQSLVPKNSIQKVYELAKKSNELLKTVQDGLSFIRQQMNLTQFVKHL